MVIPTLERKSNAAQVSGANEHLVNGIRTIVPNTIDPKKGRLPTLQQELLQSVIQLNHDMASRSVGEYNIFSVLGIQAKEVLTCRFLADLMNPRGQHGQGAIFLRLFLDDVLGMPVNSEEELNHA